MSERTSEKGNTDAPRVEENEVRSGDGHRNQEKGSGQGTSYELSHGYGKTSWTSVIFGWLAALGAGLILSGIVGGVVGGILGALGVQGGTEVASTSTRIRVDLQPGVRAPGRGERTSTSWVPRGGRPPPDATGGPA